MPPVTATGQEQAKARRRWEGTRQPEVDVATLSPTSRRREGKDTRATWRGTCVSMGSHRKAGSHRKPEQGGGGPRVPAAVPSRGWLRGGVLIIFL